MTEEQLKAKSNAILDKLEEDGFDLGDWSIEDAHNNGFIDGYHECQKEHEEKCKTAYIKGIRTMANALKDCDRTDGAWTDYFEHTVDNVIKKLLGQDIKDESQEAYKELCENYSSNKSLYTDGYSDGYKECQKEHEWHKITDWEDNSQFPKDELKTYLVRLYQDHYVICELDITEGYRQFYLPDNLEDIDPQDVIAWCEIPTFDKE